MKRWEIINRFIQKYKYTSYLEIGTQNSVSFGACFANIKIPYKVGIDPAPLEGDVTFKGTSDEYFSSIDDSVMFDIIFIDGLHHNEQVLKDIENSLKHLSENGTIVCHDCLPTTELMQERYDNGGEWTGDVWKAFAELRVKSTDLEIKVVNTDYGCGIIRRGTNIPYTTTEDYLDYSHYTVNKHELLNVISVQEFLDYYILGNQ